ncbi:hypothetical protein DVR12_12960 [Chitinophaga silvatica]|uniref:Uncharacterized protein n=1 Tax=Chitinophaga silvatica TaxID=2282649 RepID=A0A3E1YAL1_9BACT|nr:hypothetical protein [Chitinophaga silvatica]RFS22697.1 hypothetical protein DVR12_12960 [Chitinophaga silvatica]
MKSNTAIPYSRISMLFVLILVVLTWGFYNTYLIFFPSFKGFKFIQHFHGVIMLAWMIMLIIQPLLIRFGKLSLHRVIGRSSFLLAPLVVISIFLLAKMGFNRSEPPLPYSVKIGDIVLPILSMLAFALFYSLAIINRRFTYNHLRYMIGTGVLMIGPGLGRALTIYFHISFPMSVTYVLLLITVITVALLLNDLLRKNNYTAFAVMSVVNLIVFLTYELRMEQPWQSIGGFIATNFF